MFSQYAALLGKHPMATFTTPVVHAGWRSVPSTYVYTRQDRPLPLLFQEFMAKRAKRVASEDGGDVRPFNGEMGEAYIDCGHTPFLSNTEEMGDILIRAAESSA
jgi:pimeloyl-ACP methyl ester carboxylesterase